MDILGRYFSRKYLLAFFGIMALLLTVVYFLEIAELFRRASSKENVTTGMIMLLGAVKLPQTLQVILPFIVLFAAIFTLWRFAVRQEIIIARGAGLSVWQICMPLLLVVFMIGVVDVTVFNPVAAKMYGTFRRLEAKFLSGGTLLEVTRGGVWLRQSYNDGMAVIHATKIEHAPSLHLKEDVTLFIFDKDERYLSRIDADAGQLEEGQWLLKNATLRPLGGQPKVHETFSVPTTLTSGQIDDSLSSPETLSFWELPQFIEALDQTGFSSLRHRQHYNQLLLEPFWLISMLMIAMIFMQRQLRQAQALLLLGGAVLSGVAVFILNNAVLAFGTIGDLPTIVAAGAVPFAVLALSSGLLLHLEEGG